ncbi:MAG: hypothetical protein ABIF17_02215 [Patescibacteria group bacterium]
MQQLTNNNRYTKPHTKNIIPKNSTQNVAVQRSYNRKHILYFWQEISDYAKYPYIIEIRNNNINDSCRNVALLRSTKIDHHNQQSTQNVAVQYSAHEIYFLKLFKERATARSYNNKIY